MQATGLGLAVPAKAIKPILAPSRRDQPDHVDGLVLVETDLCRRRVIPGSPVPLAIFGEESPQRLRIRLANSDGHRSAASYLVRKMYAWRGYETDARPQGNASVTFVASQETCTVATITVGFDSGEGVSAQQLYPEYVGHLRGKDARICEFTRLAVDRNEHSKELLAMMFHVAYMYARRLHGCTDLLVEVNPRHATFYRRVLGFQQAGPERICERVQAPAILLWLPLEHAERQIARYGGNKAMMSATRSLYPWCFSPTEEMGITRRLATIN
ncbi:MAG TPA: hypothetical protein VGE10_12390 [Zeimonas sp.]